MTWSGRTRQHDAHSRRRQFEEVPEPSGLRIFRLTSGQREHIAACLREVDDARRALEARGSAENRVVIRALQAAADEVYELLTDLEELGVSGGE